MSTTDSEGRVCPSFHRPPPGGFPQAGQAPGAASDRGTAGRNAETELEASA